MAFDDNDTEAIGKPQAEAHHCLSCSFTFHTVDDYLEHVLTVHEGIQLDTENDVWPLVNEIENLIYNKSLAT